MKAVCCHDLLRTAAALTLLASSALAVAQSSAKTAPALSVKTLEQEFFAALRSGDSVKFLSYVSQRGMNVGSDAQHVSRAEIEQQFQAHRGLYCRLFDSSCLRGPLDLGNSQRSCSDRELLTKSEKVRTASSQVTRNGVQQAVLVAQIKNDQCANSKLVDFIFNLDADGWKLFSVP
jgi:hypothetical protein